jgi:hypothetical protein
MAEFPIWGECRSFLEQHSNITTNLEVFALCGLEFQSAYPELEQLFLLKLMYLSVCQPGLLEIHLISCIAVLSCK